MLIIGDAIKEYQKKNYKEAILLFEKAGEIYGPHLFKANIRRCQTKINTGLSDQGQKQAFPLSNTDQHHRKTFHDLDAATRFMLTRMGEISRTDEEMNNALNEFEIHTKLRSESENTISNFGPSALKKWPNDLILAPLPESTNDFKWHLLRKNKKTRDVNNSCLGLSVIVPTYNRHKILEITLACLANQVTDYQFEVVVADDGSREDIASIVKKYEDKLDIKYVRQKDNGFQVCAARNLGIRIGKYDFIAILDCDMAPNRKWVQTYMTLLIQDDDIALIGPRKYVDTCSYHAQSFRDDSMLIENLPEVKTNNSVAGKDAGSKSVDWRLDHFSETEDLRLCNAPFRYFSGGNVAFSRKWIVKAGLFDEEFTRWGGEDNEFAYRLYRQGCFFRAVSGALAYHQEPPGKENETDRSAGHKITSNIVREKIPYSYRKIMPLSKSKIHAKPLVSIYIPAFNCEDTIVRCVDSALNQSVVDLEVCICNDGSSDRTQEILDYHYADNPRVLMKAQINKGIASASNSAVRMANGYYIGQLDSDDYLEPDAVELCLNEFLNNQMLACVYTANRNVMPDGTKIKNGYNVNEFSREALTCGMIAHHFRMFTIRAWNLTEGFNENIENAVDYDMYLKLSEVGPFKHINNICYNRVLHGNNTSIKRFGVQKVNHFIAVNNSLLRQGLGHYKVVPKSEDDDSIREHIFVQKAKFLCEKN